MNTGKYNIKDFFSHQNLEKLIIPELQRDYVWQNENVLKLLESLNENAQKQKNVTEEELANIPKDLKNDFIELLKKSGKTTVTNIGFIYAYYNHDYKNRYFLIDGQQRITTIFLILLALATKENRQNDFRRNYNVNNEPKLDYKVRESSHDFLIKFTSDILEDTELENIKNKFWYVSDYDNDNTVKTILSNFKTITDYINADFNKITYEYIQKSVEFWYFNTNESSQGEELYIYMNSRGEIVQSNEKIKADLLADLNKDNEKNLWGKKWEEWQHFFWKNKGASENADNGFNEFLKWIKVINFLQENTTKKNYEKHTFLENIKDAKQIDKQYLVIEEIEKYFLALKRIADANIAWIKNEWLGGNTDLINYFILLPTLLVVKERDSVDDIEIKRFVRFLFNNTHNSNIAKNPIPFTIDAIDFTKEFLKLKSNDIADAIGLSGFNQMLNQEERDKLSLYKNPPQSINRTDLENKFWEAEDYWLFNGKIAFLIKKNFSFATFKDEFYIIRQLFEKPGDLLRRALLTKGDYAVYDGRSTYLEGERWNFLTGNRWRRLLQGDRSDILQKLIDDYKNRIEIDRNTKLTKIISSFNSFGVDKWLKYFVECEEIFKYCENKNVCFNDDWTYLLKRTNATTFKELDEFIKENCKNSNNIDLSGIDISDFW